MKPTGTASPLHVAPDGAGGADPAGPHRRRRVPRAAGLVAAVAAAVLVAGMATRRREAAAVAAETATLAVPSVSVVHPRRGPATRDLALPATLQAETDAPIYARTSGYLTRWYFDIGAHVEAGQLLADIDSPEVDEQLQQARAQLATARASYQLSALTAARYRGLLLQHGVSQQDADNASGAAAAQRAAVDAAVANVRRLEDLQRFEKVRAPFSGVVTARNANVGALVDAGSNGGQARELFHLAATQTMRVFVPVPESDSRLVHPGTVAQLTMAEFPGRSFRATLVRTSDAIDPVARTLLAELSVPNPSGELKPGSYALVHIQDGEVEAYLVPVGALIFGSDGLRVAAVESGGRATLRKIELGRDLGNEVEVVTGVTDRDAVIVNPPDSLTEGEPVRVAGQRG